jgi:hypothetical protein
MKVKPCKIIIFNMYRDFKKYYTAFNYIRNYKADLRAILDREKKF